MSDYPSITRDEIHKKINDALDTWGFKDGIQYKWANMTFNLVFEKGRLALFAKERVTEKSFGEK